MLEICPGSIVNVARQIMFETIIVYPESTLTPILKEKAKQKEEICEKLFNAALYFLIMKGWIRRIDKFYIEGDKERYSTDALMPTVKGIEGMIEK